MIYAATGLGVTYLLLAAACKAKAKFAKETGLATQYVSAVLGLIGIIGVTSSVVSIVTKFRSMLIHSAMSLDVTENFVYNAQVRCSHRTAPAGITSSSKAIASSCIPVIMWL